MKNLLHAYRGQIQGLVSQGTCSAFITKHPETHATDLYRLDTSNLNLQRDALPCSASALVSDADQLWLAGLDGKLYHSAFKTGAVKTLAKLDFGMHEVLALAVLAGQRLAVLQSKQLSIINLTHNTLTQSITLTEPATALASHANGLWFVVGFNTGRVAVYYTDTQHDAFTLSSEANLHQGQITALLFAPQELQFYSASTDKKLLLTHAQGVLQPLDKGKNSNHDAPINALLLGKERLFTGAPDRSIKAWAYSGGQPVTLKQGLASVTHLSLITYLDKPALLIAGSDASLRIVGLDEHEKFTEIKVTIHDGYALAQDFSTRNDLTDRETALNLLAEYDDKRAFDLLDTQLKNEHDQKLREQIIYIAHKAKHPRALTLLEAATKDKRHDTVRQNAFKAWESKVEAGNLHPYEIALSTQHLDIGKEALKKLAALTQDNTNAEYMLLNALQHKQAALRLYALSLLESVYGTSPQASLQALNTTYPDLQRAALIRLYQRNLLQNMEVQRALLLAQADDDATLRHTAFLVAILSQTVLTQALKALEPNLARQLQELEDFELLNENQAKSTKISKTSTKDVSKLIQALSFADYNVLLQGMSNRFTDISFLAAFALAILQDQRAFGMLLVLSQEPDKAIRAGVGRAFAWLNQADSIPTLEILLNDKEPEVRDAAFSALEKLQNHPLLTAERGFASHHQDIHARSLKTLLDVFNTTETDSKPKKSLLGVVKSVVLGNQDHTPPTPQNDTEQALYLLQTALNDTFEPIRQETFKTCLNRQLGGSEVNTLHLLLSSHYENIHREVLNELMAKSRLLPAVDWVMPLLLNLFNDRFTGVRTEAIRFALTEKKRFDTQSVLAAGVTSTFADVQGEALLYIQKHPNKANQTHLPPLLNDPHASLRNLAIQLLVDAEHQTALTQALNSPYDDVQVTAATALAKWGEPNAFSTLTHLLARQEPTLKTEKEHWLEISARALTGLGLAGNVQAFPTIQHYLKSQHPSLVAAAAKTLPYVTQLEHTSWLLDLQTDERPNVRAHASLALALLAQPQAKVVFAETKTVEQHLTLPQRLAAQLSLETVTPLNLNSFFVQHPTFIPAVLALASHEFLLHAAEPELSTWALGLNQPELQQFCADILVRHSDADERWAYLEHWLQQRQGLDTKDHDKRWNINTNVLQHIAAVLVHGNGHLKAHLLDILVRLSTNITYKEWQLHYDTFTKRFATDIQAAQAKVQPTTPAKPEQTAWNQRAFGAYLGLIRQDHPDTVRSGTLNARIKALRSLHELATRDPTLHDSVVSSFLTLLNHEHLEVRMFAFETLQTMGVDVALIGNTATTSPRTDIARKGLELLVKHYPLKQSHHLLQTLIGSNHEILAPEAWNLYRADVGLVHAAPFALQSHYTGLRMQVLQELAAHYHDAHVAPLIQDASINSMMPVAIKAAETLAQQQHPHAFNALIQVFKRGNDPQKRIILNLMRILPTAEPATWLMHYLNTEFVAPDLVNHIYDVISSQRPIEVVHPLFKRLEQHPKEAKTIIKTLTIITGFDQAIEDYNDEKADQRWLTQQFPRHEALLIELFNTLLRLNYLDDAVGLAYSLGWVHTKDADKALADALPLLQVKQLTPVLTAISHRALKREGRVNGLLTMLAHKDLDVQFLAAEGLANSGHQQGFSILFAAMDYQKNDNFRIRATLALGKSGDERALDKLLKLAEDHDHHLHEPAIEAIGHLGQSKEGERIFKHIKSRLQHAEYYSELNTHALNGLRWLNTHDAWTLIQDYAANPHRASNNRMHAIHLLQHRDTDTSRAFLLKLIREENTHHCIVEAALNTARLLLKADKDNVSEADYAQLQSHFPFLDATLLERIVKHAPTVTLLELLGKHYAPLDTDYEHVILNHLGQGVLNRTDYSIETLSSLLTAERPEVVEWIARLIGRMDTLPNTLAHSLEHSLDTYFTHWQSAHHYAEQNPTDNIRKTKVDELAKTIQQLLWSLVQHHVHPARLMHLLTHANKNERPFQIHILTALLAVDMVQEQTILEALIPLKTSPVLQVSALSNQLLAQYRPNTTLDWQRLLAQPDTLMHDTFANTLSEAAANAAHQAQVLPILIAKHNVTTLTQIANNVLLQESLRLGAIEGLARIATPEAETALHTIKQNTQDADIRKAAYRALRRWQRHQAKITTGASA